MAEHIQYWPLLLVLLVCLAYPAFVFLMARVLLAIGVEKDEVKEWALEQARRHGLIDLVRAARGLPEPPPKKEAEPSPPAETPPPPTGESQPPPEDDAPRR